VNIVFFYRRSRSGRSFLLINDPGQNKTTFHSRRMIRNFLQRWWMYKQSKRKLTACALVLCSAGMGDNCVVVERINTSFLLGTRYHNMGWSVVPLASQWFKSDNRRPLNAGAWNPSQAKSCGICGGKSGSGTDYSLSISVFRPALTNNEKCPFTSSCLYTYTS